MKPPPDLRLPVGNTGDQVGKHAAAEQHVLAHRLLRQHLVAALDGLHGKAQAELQREIMAELGIAGDRDAAPAGFGAAIRNALNPTTLVALLLAAVLVFLVANPLFQLVKDSFTRASDHSFTFANYVTAFGRPRYVQALINSVELGAAAAIFASIIAVPLAWGVSRTDVPGRGFVHVMPTLGEMAHISETDVPQISQQRSRSRPSESSRRSHAASPNAAPRIVFWYAASILGSSIDPW